MIWELFFRLGRRNSIPKRGKQLDIRRRPSAKPDVGLLVVEFEFNSHFAHIPRSNNKLRSVKICNSQTSSDQGQTYLKKKRNAPKQGDNGRLFWGLNMFGASELRASQEPLSPAPDSSFPPFLALCSSARYRRRKDTKFEGGLPSQGGGTWLCYSRRAWYASSQPPDHSKQPNPPTATKQATEQPSMKKTTNQATS